MSRRIRALKLTLAPHRVVPALLFGRLRPDLYHGGSGSPLRLVRVPAPERPEGWVRVRPLLSGICASDRKLLHLTGMGTTLMALYGLPRGGIIPGHEVVGVVTEAPRGAGVGEGERVVLEPLLGCLDKGFAPCARCLRGDDHLCAHLPDAGAAAPGVGFGLNARYGGGWSEELVAPATRAFRVPADIDDRTAVLAEPFAVAVHAVLRNRPPRDARVLVIGPGAIGLAVVHALRALTTTTVVTAGVHPASDAAARAAGADHTLRGARRPLLEAAAELLGSPVRGNRFSGPVLEDGFDVVFDTVGSEQTIDDALRLVRPRGTVVLVGTATRQRMDWSLVWHREIGVRGTVYYGTEDVPADAGVPAGRRRALAIALEVLAERRPAAMVTHVYPLEEAVAALRTAAAGPAAGAIRVAFAPNGAGHRHAAGEPRP